MQQNQVQVEDARLTVPDGGIASFVPDDDEMDDDVEDFGSEGIAQFPALAQRMSAMGRNGDDSLAHVQTGELIIPAALLAQDPALKEGLFQRLRDMGIEDPERYVVGSEGNSLNPETGLPEFFLKKLWKGIKKAVKGVVKVVKKVASVVLPIALSFTPLGPVFGSALGSGIATLINGGSFKDALKSAAISGLTAGVFQGFTGGQGSFGANVKAAITDPIGRFSQTVSGLGSTLTGGGFTGAGNLFTAYVPPAAGAVPGAAVSNVPGAENAPTISAQGATDVVASDALKAGSVSGAGTPTGSTGTALPGASSATQGATAGQAISGSNIAAADVVAPVQAPGFTASIKDAFTPGGRTFTQAMGDAFFPKTTMTVGGQTLVNPSAAQVLQANGINPLTATASQTAAAQSLISQAAPNMLRTYAPLAAAGIVAAGASGMFEPVPAEPAGVVQRDAEGNVITGADLIAEDPGKYLVGDLGNTVLNPDTGQYEPRPSYSVGSIGDLAPTYSMPTSYSVPTTFATNIQSPYLRESNPTGPFARPYVVQAADGGAIFPRRNGGIMPNEGTPGKDSVRAMLMPGEFVMTTDAVRGAGNGNVRQGINNMYAMMRNLETRGRAMA